MTKNIMKNNLKKDVMKNILFKKEIMENVLFGKYIFGTCRF